MHKSNLSMQEEYRDYLVYRCIQETITGRMPYENQQTLYTLESYWTLNCKYHRERAIGGIADENLPENPIDYRVINLFVRSTSE